MLCAERRAGQLLTVNAVQDREDDGVLPDQRLYFFEDILQSSVFCRDDQQIDLRCTGKILHVQRDCLSVDDKPVFFKTLRVIQCFVQTVADIGRLCSGAVQKLCRKAYGFLAESV